MPSPFSSDTNPKEASTPIFCPLPTNSLISPLLRSTIREYACASHAVLSGPAIDRINSSVITEVAFLDTIPAVDAGLSDKIKYLTVAPMFSEAIERTYQEISISKLFR